MGLFYSKSQTEPSPCNLLTVKIIRMKNARKADLLTQSDCYVSLSLPTASVQHFRTKTVQNSKNPMWNETFHFTIQSQVKNILELKVCDEDNITQDDHLLTVFFDVSKIQLGENIQLCFQLNPQGKEELEVEFTMESSPDPPENIVTNGVLVSREVSCLEVQVNDGRLRKNSTERKFALTVDGSYEGTQTHTLSSCLCPTSPARFHYIKYNQSALTVALPRRRRLSRSLSSQNERDMNESVTLALNSLPIQEKITIAEDRTIDLYTKANEWTQGLCFRPRNLDARLGFDLCTDEQYFLQNRRKVVAAALKDVLHLEEDLQEHEVPIVAVTTAGCGIRALTAMYGSILGLQKLRVLDCVSYISGSSGTTWTMTKLYEDADWSRKDLGEVIIEARKQAAKCKMGAFCLRSLRNYYRELSQRTQAGHKTSFIDLWGLMIESMLNDGKCHHRLSDQRRAVNQGQNPLPIYLALNVKDKIATKDFREWVEFTPYEVGFLKYGAFIRAEDFGSEFFMGRLMKKLPESRICFMQGMWSSIFSKNLLDAWHAADNSEDFWHRWTQDKVAEIEEQPDLPEKPYEMATCMFTPTSGLSTALRDILTDRPAVSKYHNFLRGFQMHNEYIQQEHFTKWKDTLLDTSPNDLRGKSEHLELVDAAFFFETSCPPLMRPERKVDIIIHLNYTGGSQTLPLEQACRYFSEQGIPFPSIGLEDDEKNLKECYMFDGADTPGAPLLLYFPLVNDTFQRYVAPGMSRSAAEMEQGKVDISSFCSPYSTREVSLKAEDFNKLLKLTNYNIMNNENMILQALRMTVARKKQAPSQPVSQAQSSA
ncbi:PREDICTED: cytosolic phospholipase A2 epsilon [Aptenodytes forsteri]|uniref:cytosolic phospholipase A2 epsilon n=1 Tax=Aptenodytes forsteri TaxID=9233 RepID=UPI0004F47675|nr:PREDICTED: cytosolic phospholipase A2 epsilon [Aptenodytes forsteri]